MQRIILTGIVFAILSAFVAGIIPIANGQTTTNTPTPTTASGMTSGTTSTPQAPATGHAQ